MSDPRQTPFKLALEACSTRFSQLLPSYGFSRDWVKSNDGSFRRHWLHDRAWKTDIVEIVYRRGGEYRIIVNVCTSLPSAGEYGTSTRLSGRSPLTPPIPMLLARFRVKRYADRVVSIVQPELSWFKEVATPQTLWRYLSVQNPRFKSSPVGIQVETYLQGL